MDKDLLKIKSMSRKGKTISAIIIVLASLMYSIFFSIEKEADKALLILDQGKIDEMVLK